MAVGFEKFCFITTGEKILNDANKQRWIHKPKSQEQASLMFYLQVTDTPKEPNNGMKSFQECVDEKSSKIIVFRAGSYRER
jgi:hypothetical protein